MRKRLIYLAAFLILLLAECLIGAFVHDDFIRPYVGDLLVTVLLCCLGRVCFPKAPWLCPAVLVFSWGVELLQLLDLPRLLGLEGTALAIALGSVFDWRDLVCYSAGCGIFALIELILERRTL